MNRKVEENTAWITERVEVYSDVKKVEIWSCRKEREIKASVSNSKKMETFCISMAELTLSQWTRKRMNVGCGRVPGRPDIGAKHRDVCCVHKPVCVQENHRMVPMGGWWLWWWRRTHRFLAWLMLKLPSWVPDTAAPAELGREQGHERGSTLCVHWVEKCRAMASPGGLGQTFCLL